MAYFNTVIAHSDHVSEMQDALSYDRPHNLMVAHDGHEAIEVAREVFENKGRVNNIPAGEMNLALSEIESVEMRENGRVIGWKVKSL